jgi:dimethylaniline monooxygenase (N-oxide forming)
MKNSSLRRLRTDGSSAAALPASAVSAGRIRVCVIGAGVCGLAAIKAAKENDFEVDAFESSDGIGGLWRYDDNRHGVAAFTHINVSKHNYCFSDFPFDSSTPDYPHHSQMLQYLQAYALKFRLLPHIMFNTTVQSVALAGDGGVVVTTTNAQRGCLTSHYDHIMIASGHHVTPITPQFPGLSSFEGQALHSISYACNLTRRWHVPHIGADTRSPKALRANV